MARPTKEPEERRDERLNVRFTAAQKAYVEEQAERAGITPTEYLRRRALGFQVSPAPARHDAALLAAINRIGVNVNQLALATHTGREFVQYWREIGAELEDILEKVAAHDR